MDTKLKFDKSKRYLEKRNIRQLLQIFVPSKNESITDALIEFGSKNKEALFNFLYDQSNINQISIQSIKAATKKCIEKPNKSFKKKLKQYSQMISVTRERVKNKAKNTTSQSPTLNPTLTATSNPILNPTLNLTLNPIKILKIREELKMNVKVTNTPTFELLLACYSDSDTDIDSDSDSDSDSSSISTLLLEIERRTNPNPLTYTTININTIQTKINHIRIIQLKRFKQIVSAIRAHCKKNKYTMKGLCKILNEHLENTSIKQTETDIKVLYQLFPLTLRILQTESCRPLIVVQIIREQITFMRRAIEREYIIKTDPHLTSKQELFKQLTLKQQTVVALLGIYIEYTKQNYIIYRVLQEFHSYYAKKYGVVMINKAWNYDSTIHMLDLSGYIHIFKDSSNHYKLNPSTKLKTKISYESIKTAVWNIYSTNVKYELLSLLDYKYHCIPSHLSSNNKYGKEQAIVETNYNPIINKLNYSPSVLKHMFPHAMHSIYDTWPEPINSFEELNRKAKNRAKNHYVKNKIKIIIKPNNNILILNEKDENFDENKYRLKAILQLGYLVELIRDVYMKSKKKSMSCNDLISLVKKIHKNQFISPQELWKQLQLLNELETTYFKIKHGQIKSARLNVVLIKEAHEKIKQYKIQF